MGLSGNIRERINGFSMKQKYRKALNQELNFDIGGGKACSEVDLLLLAHSLEKGMGIPSPRPGFGLDKARRLCKKLEGYITSGCDTKRFAFNEAVCVLEAYLLFTDNDCNDLKQEFNRVKEYKCSDCTAGSISVSDVDRIYEQQDTEQIKSFFESRHSIRNYQNKPVPQETIQAAIGLASRAPSACNRQPSKVYFTSNPERAAAVGRLVPGDKGFEEEIFNWAIVTTDRSMFGLNEALQWYVNGGIYLAYFVEALHACGIGSCIFQIPASHQDTPELRRVASIPENEAIIAAVGLGYPKGQNKFLAAARRPVEEVLVDF